MWLFRSRNDEEDSEFESDDYDSDEYETDDEELDSQEESVTHNDKPDVDDTPERAETEEEDLSEEEEGGGVVVENGVTHEEKAGHTVSSESSEEATVPESPDDSNNKNNGEVIVTESTNDDDDESVKSDDDDQPTSIAEQRALLALAAEHDRVDILQAILNDNADLIEEETDSPPLHIAILFGSVHATSCLLRMGANPAIRPGDKRFDGKTAWELVNANTKLSPSKLEGICHAFTAEALRCIGSDQVERLQHLLDSGMPPSTDIGGKNLFEWAVEMEAVQCQALTKPDSQGDETESAKEEEQDSTKPCGAVIQSHLDSDSLANLDNRLEELDSLSKALSLCLDNLAEEVSVCHGLLLLGGGASALASHVRSLKLLRERRQAELERCMLEWSDSQDELAYWLLENGGKDGFEDTMTTNATSERKPSYTPPVNEEDEEAQRRQLKAQIAASESKVRKLRASIADLSEENARDLVEVEKRGLSGGIKLVRTLREELREVEFQLTEAKNGTASCRARVNLIVARLQADKKKSKSHGNVSSTNGQAHQERVGSLFADEVPSESEKIASGDSEAIALRPAGNRGYLPLDLWEIILRIIGLGRVAVKKSVRENSPSAMII